MNATINDNASGATTRLIGQSVEVVGPGSNPLHVICRHPGERRTFGIPTSWLDGLTEPEVSSSQAEKLEPRRCPTCGQEVE